MLFADAVAAAAPVAASTTTPESTLTFHLFGLVISVFDLFVLAFTILIALGVVRSLMAQHKNLFAIGFGGIALIIFIYMDVIMIANWIHPPNA